MKPATFKYHRPTSLDEALTLLEQFGPQSRLISGGQSLGPMLNLRLARPEHVIDLNDLTEFAYVLESEGAIEIGGLTRHYQLAESAYLLQHCPLLPEVAATIGHYAIRSRGTLGGSLANADPVAQLALVAVALDARILLVRLGRRREVAAKDFFQAAMTTAIDPQELLLSVRFPKSKPGEVSAFRMFNRRHGDFALAVKNGKVQRLRVALSGISAMPIAMDEVTISFEGIAPDADWASDVALAITRRLQPEEDARVTSQYRRELAHTLLQSALTSTLEKLDGICV